MKKETKIREFKAGDEKGITKLFNKAIKAEKFHFIPTHKPLNKKQVREMEKDFLSGNSKCLIAKTDSRIVGYTSFSFSKEDGLKHKGYCSWIVDTDYQKKGIASKMVVLLIRKAKKTGLKKLECDIAKPNTASIKIVNKLGFKREGTIRKGLKLKNGKFVDSYVYGKLI